VSTGAVYGNTPSHFEKIPEDFCGSINSANSEHAYNAVRRVMETLSVICAEEGGFEVKIARCFSFIGPYLPLNGRFAVSDFISNSLSNKKIIVKGDGKAVRSFLYMADLAIWLWTILFRGKSGRPYNVGSELPSTILEIAERIADESISPLPVVILKKTIKGITPDHYVPDTSRAQSELTLYQRIPFSIAIKKTLNWYRDVISRRGN